MDFGPPWGVQDGTAIFLAIKVSFSRVARKEIIKNTVILCIRVSFRGQKRPEPRPDWSLLGVYVI